MKKFYQPALCIVFVLAAFVANAQQYSWKKGNNQVSAAGVYGTQGVPAASNAPGARRSAISWTDNNGDFWLFGGYGYDAGGNVGPLNDLWRFSTATNQWTWMTGATTTTALGIYGTQGTAAAGNTPGARSTAVSFVDNGGNLWLFGGFGYDAIGSNGELNDLWEYNIASNTWKWVKGSSSCYQNATYGTQGTAAATNVPGSRYSSTGWKDAGGNFWVFGGIGYTTGSNYGLLNDLWRYNPTTNQWTWMKGTGSINQFGIYGTQGTAAASNAPGARLSSMGWTDVAGNLWLMAGNGYATTGAPDILNDFWRYSVVNNQWTWIRGNSTTGTPQAVFGTQGTPAVANNPGGRYAGITWLDATGDLWLFGGYGFTTGNTPDQLNDLWRYDVGGDQWAWVNGSTILNQPGVYGTQGVPAPANTPGARSSAVSFKDNSNNLWLFGGVGFDALSAIGSLNDLWKYSNCMGPYISISASNGTVCAGASVTLTANGANTYTWQSLSQQTTTTLNVAPLGSTSYTVIGTDVNDCKDTASYVLTVLSLPTITAAVTSTMICAGETATLNAGGAVNYSWIGAGSGSSVVVSPTITTDFTVTGTDANGCSDVAMVTQSVSACLGIEAQNAAAVGISVFPNPNNGNFMVKLEQDNATQIIIMNALGQKVFEQHLELGQNAIQPNLARGLYTYHVMRAAQAVSGGKLVIQ